MGILLGLMATALIGLILRLEACHRGLILALERSRSELVGAIDNKSEILVNDTMISTIKDEIEASITDMAGSMRVPTAIDHLGGVIANVIQMREQWKIQKEAAEINANPLISQGPDRSEYGGPTTTQENPTQNT